MRVDRKNIQRTFIGNADAASLSYGVTMNSFVASNYTACGIDDLTRARQTIARVLGFKVTIDEAGIVAVRHETDLLRLFLLRNTGEMMLPCRIARLRFRHLAERKHRPRQL